MFLTQLFASYAPVLRDVLPEPLRGLVVTPRRVIACPGGLRIDLRGIGGPGTERSAALLEERLSALPGVERAEVNGRLGCVFVGCDPEAVDREELLEIARELDEQERHAHETPVRVVEEHIRSIIRLATGVAGVGTIFTGIALRAPRLSPAVPALVNLLNATPVLREELDKRIGRGPANALFHTANLVTQTLTLRPLGLVAHSMAALSRYVETRAAQRSWVALERRLAEVPGSYRHVRARFRRRPTHLPHGPIERYADLASPAAALTYGFMRFAARQDERALAVLTAITPKIAEYTREAFAGAVRRALGERDTVVFDAEALRRMDRVDTVVLDSDALTTGSWAIDRVEPLVDELDLNELYARLYRLLDFTDPGATRIDEEWSAAPLTDPARFPGTHATEWRGRGMRLVEVRRADTPVALVGLSREIDPLAVPIVAAAKAAGTVLLAGDEDGTAHRLAIDQVLPGGADLAHRVFEMQAEGHCVLVVSRRAREALAQADIGFGVMDPGTATVPWDADVAGGLPGLHLLLIGLRRAETASRDGVRIGVAGGLIGALFSFAGPASGAVGRAQLVSSLGALVAVAWGELAGRALARTPVPLRADPTPWHAMSVPEVLARLGSSPRGIPEEEAERRRAAARPVEIAAPRSLARTVLGELANPLTPALASGAAIAALIGSAVDSVMISGVMVINAFIGGVQQSQADRELTRLTETTSVRVRVRRPEGTVEIRKEDLVPGDVVELRAGDAIPADGRVIKSVGLEVDESTLTGESQLIAKRTEPTIAAAIADRASMVYEGTTVAAGTGLAVVVATGEMTEARRAAQLGTAPPRVSGVELRMRELSRRVLPLSVGSGLFLLVTELLRGRSLAAALVPAVSLTVAAVPEGLPFVATAAELAAARRLSRRAALVRNPKTIEALGRVNVLCFDKTGTLTEGRISLQYVSDGRAGRPVEELTHHLRRVIAAAVRASPKTGGGRVLAHPTDRAIHEAAERLSITPREGLQVWERVDEMPFEPGRGYHAVLGRTEHGHLLSVKGAPEIVIDHCTTALRGTEVVPCDDAVRHELTREVARLARQGYRVLAVAQRPASDRSDLDESRIDELCFLGFLGLADPVRATAAESVDRLMRAGVRIVMITGDHPSTAEAIAVELNTLNGGRIMTGPELDELDDETLTKLLPEVSVFARVTPAHKVRIVSCLRRAGEVVAVTGDGANDAPAIRIANVGIALGSRATPAARSAADLVVTDDRIETVVDAIVEGRAMWSSVRDALSILVGGNLGEIIYTIASSLIGATALNARQLLLVNLLTDLAPAIAVALRPPASTEPERLLTEGPEASLGASLMREIYVRAGVTALAAAMGWLAGRATGTRGRAATIGLVALVTAQLLQTLSGGGTNRTVVLAVLASFALLCVIVTVPGVSGFFGCRPLGPVGWTVGLGSAGLAALIGEVVQRWLLRPVASAAPRPALTPAPAAA